ncbi:MAG: RidA family protein [Methyloligellaceae bacterium]
MTGVVEAKLADLGIELPNAAAPAANYVPFQIFGNQLFVSGQLPLVAGGPDFKGTLGVDIDVETAQKAARACALNILAQAKSALGDLDRIAQCHRLGGFVNSTPDFADHPKVVNGASDFLVEVLGDKGRHTRFAVGVASLPFGVAVEIDALLAIE